MTLNQSRGNFTRGKQLVGAAALALGFAAILAPHSAHAATHMTHSHMTSINSGLDSACTPTYPPCGTSATGFNGYTPATSGSNGYIPATTGQTLGATTDQTPVIVQQPAPAPVNVVLTPIAINIPQQSLPPILVQPAQTTFNVTPPQITVNLPAPAQQTIYFAQNPAPVIQYNTPPAINFVPSTQPQLPPILLPAPPIATPAAAPTGYQPTTQAPCYSNNSTPSSYTACGNNSAPSSYTACSNNSSVPYPTWSYSNRLSLPSWFSSNDAYPCPTNW